MTFRTSFSSAPFKTYPLAPARIAANTESSSPNIVSITTLVRGLASTILRVASMPFICGIWMSMSTICGCALAAFSTASSPVAASPTTSYSDMEASMALSPWRNRAWSSARRTRWALLAPMTLAGSSLWLLLCSLRERQTGQDARAALRKRFDG